MPCVPQVKDFQAVLRLKGGTLVKLNYSVFIRTMSKRIQWHAIKSTLNMKT